MFKFIKTHPKAVSPSKSHKTDSGFDLTLIEKYKKYNDVTLYNTGIKVQPPSGYYFDLVPRSSIIKSGYMLANSVGIIDQDYQGNIYVPLVKIDKTKPDLELPCRLVQLVLRKVIEVEAIEVESFEDETKRGDGGFGSSNKN